MELTQKHINRFWKQVSKEGPTIPYMNSPCWKWVASKDSNGYGRLRVGRTRQLAHRISWVIAHGPIPGGLWVLHKCDNQNCVNPDHLFLGTADDNAKDMAQKGRAGSGPPKGTNQGSTNARAKLTEDDVREIRTLYATGQYSHTELGSMFGVHGGEIGLITQGKVWTHVPMPNTPMPVARRAKGSNQHCSKLTEADIPKIRELHKAGISCYRIAKQFNVAKVTIPKIINGKTWKHISL